MLIVIPAKAGIQYTAAGHQFPVCTGTSFAGVTMRKVSY